MRSVNCLAGQRLVLFGLFYNVMVPEALSYGYSYHFCISLQPLGSRLIKCNQRIGYNHTACLSLRHAVLQAHSVHPGPEECGNVWHLHTAFPSMTACRRAMMTSLNQGR